MYHFEVCAVTLNSNATILLDVTLYGGIRSTLHSNNRAARIKIIAFQSGTCTT